MAMILDGGDGVDRMLRSKEAELRIGRRLELVVGVDELTGGMIKRNQANLIEVRNFV